MKKKKIFKSVSFIRWNECIRQMHLWALWLISFFWLLNTFSFLPHNLCRFHNTNFFSSFLFITLKPIWTTRNFYFSSLKWNDVHERLDFIFVYLVISFFFCHWKWQTYLCLKRYIVTDHVQIFSKIFIELNTFFANHLSFIFLKKEEQKKYVGRCKFLICWNQIKMKQKQKNTKQLNVLYHNWWHRQ